MDLITKRSNGFYQPPPPGAGFGSWLSSTGLAGFGFFCPSAFGEFVLLLVLQ